MAYCSRQRLQLCRLATPALLALVTWQLVPGREVRRRGAAAFAPSVAWTPQRTEQKRARLRGLQRSAAAREDASSWVLPSVDKDVDEFHRGHGGAYSWLQTSETLYVFAPVQSSPAEVELSVQDEGRTVRFAVDGTEAVAGVLAHAVKPGSEIWMIEEAPDGRSFAVAEFDKVPPGVEWTSLLKPAVSLAADYARPRIDRRSVTPEQVAETVEATISHLQREHGSQRAKSGAAAMGDVLTVDIEAFELAADGSRGAPMEAASATGFKIALGSPDSGLLPELHEQLVGIAEGESRDVPVTLGKRGGGKRVLCAVSCTAVEETLLPVLSDDFARAVKRQEQFAQAGTVEGVPEEEEGAAETFTMEALRSEIAAEVEQTAMREERAGTRSQLEACLTGAAQVTCDWAALDEQLQKEEEFASIISAVAEREGIVLDEDEVERLAWDALGTPKKGETIAEVGSDPAREFQAARRKVYRRELLEEVMGWMEARAEVVAAE